MNNYLLKKTITCPIKIAAFKLVVAHIREGNNKRPNIIDVNWLV